MTIKVSPYFVDRWWDRYTYFKPDLYDPQHFGEAGELVNMERSNLISSKTIRGTHRPTIDLDFEASLIPSSTPGHYHLYLEKDLSWLKYRVLLRVMKWCGLIERGFYNNSVKCKQTLVRPPWVKKTPTEMARKNVKMS